MSAADAGDLVARLRRDLYVRKGDVRWRKRAIDRFSDSRFPHRAMAIFNAKFGDKAVDAKNHGRRGAKIDGRIWLIPDLIHALEDGVLPNEIPQDGNPYHDDIFIGEGPLATELTAAVASSGLPPEELLVLSEKHDPFGLDTPAGHRDAAWLREHLDRLAGEGERIHLHGLHYRLVSAGGIVKPNGAPYRNTKEDDAWLSEVAAKRARWLGYIPFDRIDDNRNPDPVIFRPERPRPPSVNINAAIGSYSKEAIETEAEAFDVRPSPYLYGFDARQPYAFAFFGEKTSLNPVLRPLAQAYHANMYLALGELSDTLVHQMASDGAADGRPLIVFTFTDFDPAGVSMSVSIARRLQALRALEFPSLRGQVVPVALTLAQALAQRLPTTPVKRGEKRRERWQQAYGPALFDAGLIESPDQAAQVEIDALAALRPAVFTAIAEAAIRPYHDLGLAPRYAAVKAAWTAAATEAVNAKLDDEAVGDLQARTEFAIDDYNSAVERLRETRASLEDLQAEVDALANDIDPPEPPAPPEPEIDEAAHHPLLDLDWDFVTATASLRARKSYDEE
jgi:hypothetical protein